MIYRGLSRAGMHNVPVVVCVSDFEGVGVHAWIEDLRQYVICGTSLCHQQAVDFGLAENQRFQTSGMVSHAPPPLRTTAQALNNATYALLDTAPCAPSYPLKSLSLPGCPTRVLPVVAGGFFGVGARGGA